MPVSAQWFNLGRRWKAFRMVRTFCSPCPLVSTWTARAKIRSGLNRLQTQQFASLQSVYDALMSKAYLKMFARILYRDVKGTSKGFYLHCGLKRVALQWSHGPIHCGTAQFLLRMSLLLRMMFFQDLSAKFWEQIKYRRKDR